MIDSHAHLNWDAYDDDRDQVVSRSLEAGIEAFIHPGVHVGDFGGLRNLKSLYPGLHIAVGVHPCHADEWDDKTENYFEGALDQAIAIGETGLDYYHQESSPELQEKVFRKQCQIAKRASLPLIIHCREAGATAHSSREAGATAHSSREAGAIVDRLHYRDAFEDTLRILREEEARGGVMHCYTGTAEYAAKFWELGFYIAFGGAITFKNSQILRAEAQKIPLNQIILETDCPFLAPQKYRGKRNEPSFMTEVCSTLADLKEISYEELDELTTTNTKRLFGI
ncbi:MAG: TatD family hydrolase [Candidatus Caenarcaniphilales bacterium]|nr:TatD family hydrolase [Candidatus Caenarcaniphilales bacterium]